MTLKTKSGLPSWAVIGAVLILLPIFTLMTIRNVQRESQFATQLLFEKGAALIRSFEAGTRTGMMGMHRGEFRLQHLLTETARQPDIVYLVVTDMNGRVLAHSDPAKVGDDYGADMEMAKIKESKRAQWRQVEGGQGKDVFEVFGRFEPTRPLRGMGFMRGPMLRGQQPPETGDANVEPARIIYVGLEMTAVEKTRRSGVLHAIVMGAILLLAGFAGIALLMMTHSQRVLRGELVRHQRLATVGRLAAGVAHEIRNPLSSIKGFATYFGERYSDNPKDAQTAAIMIQEVDRLNRVVGQLLEFSRPIGIQRREVNLGEVISDSLRMIEGPRQARQIELQTDIHEPGKGTMIDADRLNQVLLNLYLNALDAMDPGGVLRVSAQVADGGRAARIRVVDNGCGIAPEHLGQIFEPYFTTKPAGTGLGLAIAHNIVETMGGKIEVQSRLGLGTTFEVTLPI